MCEKVQKWRSDDIIAGGEGSRWAHWSMELLLIVPPPGDMTWVGEFPEHDLILPESHPICNVHDQ